MATEKLDLRSLGYLTEPEMADLLDRSPLTLRNWRARRKGPPYVRVDGLVLYPIADTRKYLARHVVRPGERSAA